MRRRHLGANTRLAFWNHRIEESGDVNTFFLQFARELLGDGGFTEHHRDNRVVGACQGKACGGHLFAEQARVSPQAIAQFAARFHHLQHLDGGGDNGRRQGVGEQIRTRTLAQPLNDFFACGGVTA